MAKPITSFDRTCDWNGNRLEVYVKAKHLYIVTFNERVNQQSIPLPNLNTWLRKVESVISARMEFIKQLSQIKESGIHRPEMEAYRCSSKLYNQMCNIAHFEDITSIDLIAAGYIDEGADPLSPNLKDRVHYEKKSGVTFVGPSGLNEGEQAEVEKSYLGIKEVVEETFQQLYTETIYKRPTKDEPITDFRQFNTTFNKAKETFDKFKIVEVRSS